MFKPLIYLEDFLFVAFSPLWNVAILYTSRRHEVSVIAFTCA